MPSACVLTFGCQMNVHDSEIVAGQLEKLGYDILESDRASEADAIFVNTCTVREHAKSRGLAQLRILGGMKRRRPDLFIAAMGCVASEERDRLFEMLPFLDAVIPTDQVTNISRMLRESREDFGAFGVDRTGSEELTADTPRRRFSDAKAFVTIITGCNMNCTYCIVPQTRGREKSRPGADILREVRGLVSAGYREIMLLGQTVNAYGEDLPGPESFLNLLRGIDREFPGGRVRFLSPHPKKVTEELASAWPDLGSLCEHIHLPVQSGSDRILRRMKRLYTRAEFIRTVEWLRKYVPEISITTDVIVGFPGETESDFRETLSLLDTMRFDSAYLYIYSPRSGTAATHLKDEIPPHDVSVDRHRRLVEIQAGHTRAALRSQIGRVVEVLFEEPARSGAGLFGKSRAWHSVVSAAPEQLIGRVVSVKIESVSGTTLFGRPVSDVSVDTRLPVAGAGSTP